MTEPALAAYAPDFPAPSTEATGSEDVPVEPVVAAEPGTPLHPLLPFAVVASCLLHVAAAAMVFSKVGLPEFGVLKTDSDALSLETTQTIILESTRSEPLKAAAAAAAAMPQGSVATVDAEPEPLAQVKTVPVKEAAAPPTLETSEEPLKVLRGSGAPAETVPTRTAEQKPDAERAQRRKTRREQAHRQRAERQPAGGPTSRSNAAKGAASGRASASRGSVLRYAARVRAKVARHKPSSRGRRGTVRVSFGVSRSGGLSYARLARSSGSAALDQAALSAVRRAAPFGAPPAGALPAQLRFAIPFYFR
jgi:protein TonB